MLAQLYRRASGGVRKRGPASRRRRRRQSGVVVVPGVTRRARGGKLPCVNRVGMLHATAGTAGHVERPQPRPRWARRGPVGTLGREAPPCFPPTRKRKMGPRRAGPH